jgi:hypothetical protein
MIASAFFLLKITVSYTLKMSPQAGLWMVVVKISL